VKYQEYILAGFILIVFFPLTITTAGHFFSLQYGSEPIVQINVLQEAPPNSAQIDLTTISYLKNELHMSIQNGKETTTNLFIKISCTTKCIEPITKKYSGNDAIMKFTLPIYFVKEQNIDSKLQIALVSNNSVIQSFEIKPNQE
jgi:hypothetical protein